MGQTSKTLKDAKAPRMGLQNITAARKNRYGGVIPTSIPDWLGPNYTPKLKKGIRRKKK